MGRLPLGSLMVLDSHHGSSAPDYSPCLVPGKTAPAIARLMALYPRLRQTGWAILESGSRCDINAPRVAASGVAPAKVSRKLDPSGHINAQLKALTAVTGRWHPECIVRSRAGGLAERSPGLRRLEAGLGQWAAELGLPSFAYPATEVRSALVGKSNASKDELDYTIMQRLRLIGQIRTHAEWEAIAAGIYHLQAHSNQVSHPNSSC